MLPCSFFVYIFVVKATALNRLVHLATMGKRRVARRRRALKVLGGSAAAIATATAMYRGMYPANALPPIEAGGVYEIRPRNRPARGTPIGRLRAWARTH